MYKLLNNSNCILRTQDETFIPVSENNKDYQAYLKWLDGYEFDGMGWVKTSEGNTPEPADVLPQPIPDPKLLGVEFEGIMCSATKDDQDGISAVVVAYQMQQSSFQPTIFNFANGNKLLISSENLSAFLQVWIPFRQSFFKVDSDN